LRNFRQKIQLLKESLKATEFAISNEIHVGTEHGSQAELRAAPPCIKVRAVLVLLMLNEMGLGKTTNDLTKICKLIAHLIDGGFTSIYKVVQKGITFSEKHHSRQINEVNKILKDLNASFLIDIEKEY
jgi:hypothetical protein